SAGSLWLMCGQLERAAGKCDNKVTSRVRERREDRETRTLTFYLSPHLGDGGAAVDPRLGLAILLAEATSRSSSGLGHWPLTPVTRVRISYGTLWGCQQLSGGWG